VRVIQGEGYVLNVTRDKKGGGGADIPPTIGEPVSGTSRGCSGLRPRPAKKSPHSIRLRKQAILSHMAEREEWVKGGELGGAIPSELSSPDKDLGNAKGGQGTASRNQSTITTRRLT